MCANDVVMMGLYISKVRSGGRKVYDIDMRSRSVLLSGSLRIHSSLG